MNQGIAISGGIVCYCCLLESATGPLDGRPPGRHKRARTPRHQRNHEPQIHLPARYPRHRYLHHLRHRRCRDLIVAENFGGLATDNLAGTTADTFAPAIVTAGGSATWVGSAAFKADGSVVDGFSRSVHLNLGSYINDAKGTPEGLFELTVTISETTGTWLTVGFSSLNSPPPIQNFIGAGGLGTMAYRSTGAISSNLTLTYTPTADDPGKYLIFEMIPVASSGNPVGKPATASGAHRTSNE